MHDASGSKTIVYRQSHPDERCLELAGQFGAITVVSSCAIIDQDICMGCGVCVELCPNGAVSLVRDSSRGEPLEIFDLMEEAASG